MEKVGRRGEKLLKKDPGTSREQGHTFPLSISSTKIPLRAFAALKWEA